MTRTRRRHSVLGTEVYDQIDEIVSGFIVTEIFRLPRKENTFSVRQVDRFTHPVAHVLDQGASH